MGYDLKIIGQSMYNLCVELFPICRSITGNGVRKTLSILNSVIGGRWLCAKFLQARKYLIGAYQKNGISDVFGLNIFLCK